jgi:hypothetical protein
VNVKDIKCLFKWWEEYEIMFPTIGFLVHKILGIVGLEIEMEMIFSLARILTNLRRSRLQLDNLEKFIFVNKN